MVMNNKQEAQRAVGQANENGGVMHGPDHCVEAELAVRTNFVHEPTLRVSSGQILSFGLLHYASWF